MYEHESDGHGNKEELYLAAGAPRGKIYVNMTGVLYSIISCQSSDLG